MLNTENTPKIRTQNETFAYVLITLATIWIMSSMSTGFVSIMPYSGWLPMYPVWLFLAVLVNREFLSKWIKQTGWLVLFNIIIITTNLFADIGISTTYTRAYIGMLVAASFYVFWQDDKTKFKKIVVSFFYVELICQFIYGIFKLITEPYLIRWMFTSTVDITQYPFMPTYGHVYLAVLLIMCILFCFNRLTLRHQVLSAVIFILSIMLVIMANVATAIVFAIAALVVGIFGKRIRNVIIIACVGILIMTVFSGQVADILKDISRSEHVSGVISDKIYEVAMSIEGREIKTVNGTYHIRQEKLEDTMEVIKTYPFLGIQGRNKKDVSLGMHTTWQDDFGRYGLLRIILVYLFFFVWFMNMQGRFTDDKMKYSYYMAVLMVLAIGFVNPILKMNIEMFIFFVFPLSEMFCRKEVDGDKDDNSKFVDAKSQALKFLSNTPQTGESGLEPQN